MYNSLTFYTFIALVIFFVSVEIYRSKFFVRGVIVELCTSELGIEDFILSRLKVQLKNGEVVEAEASQCTMCMGNLSVGDEVSISRKDNRYIVNLPFKLSKNKKNKSYCYNR